MDLLAGEKRKNDETRRRFPWWLALLAVGFVLSVILLLQAQSAGSSTVSDSHTGESLALTATYVIEQATALAGGVFFEENPPQAVQDAGQMDSIYMTATAIIQGATATAQASP
jgi:hypothetical protein